MKKGLFMIILIASIISCNKSNEFENSNEVVSKTHKSGENFINPYDSLGEQHNNVMDFVLEQKAITEYTEREIFDAVFIETKATLPDGYTHDEYFQYTKAGTDFLILNKDNPNLAQMFLDKELITLNMYPYIDSLLKNIPNLDYQNSLKAIGKTELDVDESQLLTQNEKNSMWGFLAIYKYSLQYWNSYDKGVDWRRVASSDALGLLIGTGVTGNLGAGAVVAAVASLVVLNDEL